MLKALLALPSDVLGNILSYLESINDSIYALIDNRWVVFEMEHWNDRVRVNLYEKKIKNKKC
jgi:hypothetical protein